MLIALLVGMVVCSLGGMAAVEGRPVSSDLLTGREFLEVYMRRQPHYLRHNTIPHKDDEHFHELNDISSSSLDEDLSEEEDEDEEDDEEDSTSEQPDLLTTTSSEELDTTTTTDEPDTTIMETTRAERSTTESEWVADDHPSQVVSVRVSSSVVRKRPEIVDQKSQEEKKVSVSYRVEAKAADSFPSASHTLEKFATKPNETSYATAEARTYQRINLGSDPQNSPISYETSVSSATSDTSIRFYREPPRFEYRTEGSERQQRNFQDSVFGQRQKPFNQQDIYKTETRQALSETERSYSGLDDLYRTTPSRPFDKTEAIFSKTTEAFGKTSQDVFDKISNDFNKQDQLYSKSEQIFNKPQQIYTKSEDYIKTEPDFSKIVDQDNVYGRRKQPFGTRQLYRQESDKKEQGLSSSVYNGNTKEEFGKRQEFSQPSFEKSEQESQPSYNKPIHNSFQQERPEKIYGEPEKIYGEPEKVYGEPEKVYGQPEKVYGQPEKVYSEPEKVYGQPEKIYGESEKTYGQPEKVYGEPGKVYGQPEKAYGQPEKVYGVPEQNYEVDETVSVRTNGRTHGLQPPSTKDDKHKFGYVVEGSNFRKYRVEERTSDGFIVGEYGVVSHDDGSLRGVRYTADSNINPRLIYEALVKFLSLK